MQVVTIIPIVRGIPKDSLTYFSTHPIRLGDIATVSVQSREIKAIVIDVIDARQVKTGVKHGDFVLRKILSVEPGFLSPTLITTAKQTAEYYVTSVSQVLGAMLPKNVLAEAERIKILETRFPNSQGNRVSKISYIEGSREDRFDWITANILCKKKRVLYISPSNHELSKAKQYLSTQDRLVFASPEYGFAWLPFVDTIILDDVSGAGYHDRSRAKIDFKKVYEFHTQENNQELIFADSVLELKYFANSHDRLPGPSHTRLPSAGPRRQSCVLEGGRVSVGPAQDCLVHSLSPWPKIKIVKKEKSAAHKSWLVSQEVKELTEKIINQGNSIFFFAPRKSVASVTICGDCGEVVRCEKCKHPLTLAKRHTRLPSAGPRRQSCVTVFVCKKCEQVSPADAKCAYCNSWKLHPLGVTVESVASELIKLFPKTSVLKVSSDVTKTKTQLKKVVKQFYNTQGAILVGTELAIPYLEDTRPPSAGPRKRSCDCVISSIDAYLSGSNLNATDKAARLIFETANIAGGKVLIETANVEQKFFQNISQHNLNKYREEELKERKKYNYPPYSLIIKAGTETYFVRKENWPDKEIVEKIRALPKGVLYVIDADRAV